MFRTWWHNLRNRSTPHSRTSRRRPAAAGRLRPGFETLEDRSVPATLTVGANINLGHFNDNQSEGSIAVDPTNPSRLFAVGNTTIATGGLFGSFSTNAGTTWTARILADGNDGLPNSCCDAKAVFDRFGNLFVTYIDFSRNNIVIALSTNGGQSFTSLGTLATVTATGTLDQPSIAVGPGGVTAPSSVWVTYSRNGQIEVRGASVRGLNLVDPFGTAQVVPGSGGGGFGDIAVGPSGQVTITYQNGGPGNGKGPSSIFASTDIDGLGAANFQPAPITVTATNVGIHDDLLAMVPTDPAHNIDAEPTLAWSYTGTANGRLYLVYTDESFNETDDTDILVRVSLDGGQTWSPTATRINDDATPRAQFLPAAAVDPTSGALAVIWYDARNDFPGGPGDTDGIANNEVQLWGTVGTVDTNGATVFLPNVQISRGATKSAAAFNSIGIGDYTGVTFANNVLYPIWADNSSQLVGNLDQPRLDFGTAQVIFTPDIIQPPFTPITVSGRVYTDNDGNGLDNNGADPGRGSVAVTLYRDANNNSTLEVGTDLVVDSMVSTPGSGDYAFANLGAGTYFLQQAPVANAQLTQPIAPGYYTIGAQSGVNLSGLNFGNFVAGTIRGRVFNDLNGDGDDEAGTDPGQNLVVIQLFRDANGNATLDINDGAAAFTTVSAKVNGVRGSYGFNGLTPGTYFIRQAVPQFATETLPGAPNFRIVTINSSGLQVVGQDFGDAFSQVVLSGRVFNDANGDGNDAGGADLGVNGVTIQLFRDVNGNGTLELAQDILETQTATTALSGQSGSFTFSNLQQNSFYFIQIVTPEGFTLTRPTGSPLFYTVNVVPAIDGGARDFGVFDNVDVTGRVYEDIDGDGTDNSGNEPGLNGVQVTLYQDLNGNNTLQPAIDRLITQATTDTAGGRAGQYQFANLPPGTYFVQQTVPAGSTQLTPAANGVFLVQASSGMNAGGRDFGNFRNGSISGRVYTDADGDGTDDGGNDPAIGNVTVQLFRDVNGDGLLDNGDTLAATRMTGSDGRFVFNAVGPGSYLVHQVVPAGLVQVTPTPNPDFAVTALSNTSVPGRDFGNFSNVNLSGRAFADVNGDGNGTGDGPVSGLTIELYRDDNNNGVLETGIDTLVASTTTAPVTGAYAFANLSAGQYLVHPILPPGAVTSTPLNGDHVVSAVSGNNLTGRDFGLFQTVSVGGRAYVDANGDGSDNGGTDAGLAGVAVELYRDGNGNGQLDANDLLALPRVVVGADGAFAFPAVGPGNYILHSVTLLGFALTEPTGGGDYFFNVGSGGSVLNRNFGNFQMLSIAGRVYADANGDGQGAGDNGLSAVTVQLLRDNNLNGVLDPGDTQVRSTMTDGTGAYNFADVGPGRFLIHAQLAAGRVVTQPAVPGDYAVAATSGASAAGRDFGVFEAVNLSGRAFSDSNGDGSGTGDPGLGNVTVQLLRDNNSSGRLDQGDTLVSTATTATDGTFAFAGVGPGRFLVHQVLPAGRVATSPVAVDYAVTTASGAAVANLDFGDFQTFAVRGTVIDDRNGDGSLTGDPGRGGATLQLFRDANGDGVLDSSDPLVATTTAANDGTFAFTGVGPGRFLVHQGTPGALQTFPTQPPDYALTGVGGVDVVDRVFGGFQTVAVRGRRFVDVDGNGTDNGGTEPGLAGATIQLYRDGDGNGQLNTAVDTVFATTTSAGDGSYAFPAVGPGAYLVTDVGQPGQMRTTPVSGFYSLTTQSGTDVTGLNFGRLANANRTFVAQVYRDLLGRAPEAGATPYWGGQLDAGLSRAAFVAIIQSTDEYRTLQVQLAYRRFLGRDADPATVAAAMRAFSGTPLFVPGSALAEQFRADVLGSAEYFFGRGGGTNAGFVNALFRDVLNRGADAEGLAFFTGLLNQGVSRTAVARAVLSTEAAKRVEVDALYQALLRRPADVAGREFFVAFLTRGLITTDTVVLALVASDEYLMRL